MSSMDELGFNSIEWEWLTLQQPQPVNVTPQPEPQPGPEPEPELNPDELGAIGPDGFWHPYPTDKR